MVIAQALPNDAELFARSREGDPEAFACLVQRHQHGLVNYLSKLCGCRSRAEDLAQEAFLRLYAGQGQYREEGRLQAYLYRIATNLLRSQERRQARWHLLSPRLTSSPPESSEQRRRLLESELHREVRRALVALPLRYRSPLVLAEVEGWPYRRIAELLGCREGTVKSRIHRGRKLLRAKLDPYLRGGTA